MKPNVRLLVTLSIPCSILVYGLRAGDSRSPDKNETRSSLDPRTRGHYVVFDINRISTFIRNNGSFNRNPVTGNAGFEWPKGSGRYANYASGLWLGGKVHDTVRVAVAEYSYEYDAGPMRGGVNPDDPQWRVYRIKTGDNATNNPDYAEWPFREGAPFRVTATGDTLPLLIGDMTIWAVFNDNNPALHTNMNTLPLGVEVQLTAYAYDIHNALGDAIFYSWKLINKSGETIDSTFVTVWTDIDLGDSGDDFDGCDTTLGLGYTYNDGIDAVYEPQTPATGFDFLQGPLVPGAPTDTARFPDGRIFPGKRLLKMTSFIKYNNDTSSLGNPNTGQEVFNYQKGVDRFGAAILNNNGQPTTLMFPGDPNLPSGPANWIEAPGSGGDRRFMMSAGPFTMAAGDTQEIVAANLIAIGNNPNHSVTALKNADVLIQQAYESNTTRLPVVSVEVSYPTDTTATLHVLANARLTRVDSIGVLFNQRGGSPVDSLPLFDDGTHGDSAASDGVWGNSKSIRREPEGMYLNLVYRDSLGRRYAFTRYTDFITTVGPVQLTNPVIFSDNLDSNGIVSPGENIRYGFTVENGTPVTLRDLFVFPDVFYSTDPMRGRVDSIAAWESFSWVYNPNEPWTYFDFQVPSVYTDSFFVVPVRVSDTRSNLWDGTLSFRVVQLVAPYGSPVTHVAGQSEWSFNVLVVDPLVALDHSYQISIRDSVAPIPIGSFTLRDVTADSTLLSGHEYPDPLGHNIPVTDGFKVLRGANFGNLALREDSTRWISPFSVWLQGFRFTEGPPAAFDGGATPGFDLPNYLAHLGPVFNWASLAPVEIRFGATATQKAYRLRRTGGVGTAYVIQAVNPFVDVPFTAWDVSGSSPRQLTIAWRDQNNTSTWDPPVDNDGVEVVFVYDRTYDSNGHQWPYQGQGGDSTLWSDVCTVGPQADIIYGLSLAVLPGHTLNENPGTLYLRPWYGLTSSDLFTFNPTIVLGQDRGPAPAHSFLLRQNYPNPFNPSTAISFSIPAKGNVSLKIYNILGQQVVTLIDQEFEAGSHVVSWKGEDSFHRRVATGVYFYRLEAGEFTAVRKLLLLR